MNAVNRYWQIYLRVQEEKKYIWGITVSMFTTSIERGNDISLSLVGCKYKHF